MIKITINAIIILFNISEKGIIDNNLFGYIIYGANISSICDNGLKLRKNIYLKKV